MTIELFGGKGLESHGWILDQFRRVCMVAKGIEKKSAPAAGVGQPWWPGCQAEAGKVQASNLAAHSPVLRF